MNFLAHYRLATDYLTPVNPLAPYAVGTALPDLLPLASARLRQSSLAYAARETSQDRAILAGVTAHLETDATFHKTAAFKLAQTAVGEMVTGAGFTGIRVRRFFLAHILVELALDAVLLRRDRGLADRFYSAFSPAEILSASRWAEGILGRALPHLTPVLTRFAGSRYLFSYADDLGIAAGIDHLCARARQETFTGPNAGRLITLVTVTVEAVSDVTDALMTETANALGPLYPPTTEK